jgi:hypothetical protein
MSKNQGNERILLIGDYPALESAFAKEIKETREHEPFHAVDYCTQNAK